MPDDTLPRQPTPSKPSHQERLEARRSAVRVWVTHLAALYLFVGGGLLILVWLFFDVGADKFAQARDLYTTLAPIATGVVTYWFASRAIEKGRES